MPPQRARLAQSESKARFIERLGLDWNNSTFEVLYKKMKTEAAEGRKNILKHIGSPAPQCSGNMEPQYSSAQISGSAISCEVSRIYHFATRETRAVYDLGRDPDSAEEVNWVIRWMLWHVFRYRDSRNKSRAAVSQSRGGPREVPSTRTAKMPPTSPPTSATRQFWDPVRASIRPGD